MTFVDKSFGVVAIDVLDLEDSVTEPLYPGPFDLEGNGSQWRNPESGVAIDAVDHEPSLHDFEPEVCTFHDEVVDGLRAEVKTLPCKYLYDAVGSELFDEICELDEYYPTRTELSIMNDSVEEIACLFGDRFRLVEYGSGSSVKTRVLLSRLTELDAYVPVDISRSHLCQSANRLSAEYPYLPVIPVCADYTVAFHLPATPLGEEEKERNIVYFPGSTIGNFHPSEAKDFLVRVAEQCGLGGGLLIGVDLKKDANVMRAAYNDARGVTAAFNLNLLARINRELNGDFVLGNFEHSAFYNAPLGRIEMHLVSTVKQMVRIGREFFQFDEGESIRTECSYKYTVDEFANLARTAGFDLANVWTDANDLFSVQYFTVSRLACENE
jgi:dimethylhistidine N-methyltransferase